MSRAEKKEQQSRWSEFKMDLTSGSLAGIGIAYSTFPAEAFKKYRQTNQTGAFKPYRGSLLFAANIVPTTGIQWTTDGIVRQYLPENANFFHQLAASAFCGITGAVTATPVENSVLRQQIMGIGARPVIKDMLKQGYSRPWKTYPLIATRDAIFTMFMMSILPAIDAYSKENLDERYHWPANLAGATIGAALSHPFDTVASNIQKTHDRISAQTMATFLYKTGGVKAFYQGFISRVFLFAAFSNGIPELKKAADHYLYGRSELPQFFKRMTKAVGAVPNNSSESNHELNKK